MRTSFQAPAIADKNHDNLITADMTEGASTSSDDAAAARAAEQARLRKERREAKIKSGGAARLNRITGLGGGIQRGAQSRRGLNLDPSFLTVPYLLAS